MKIKKIILGAVGYINHYKLTLIQFLWAPLLIIIGCELLVRQSLGGYFYTLSGFISAMVYVLIAVFTHRIILIGTYQKSITHIFSWGWRETKFLLYTYGVYLIALLPLLMFFWFMEEQDGFNGKLPVGTILLIVLLIIYAWVVSRFSLVLPAVAIDKPLSLIESWRLTSKYHLQICVAVFVVPILISIVINFMISKVPFLGFVEYIFSSLVTVYTVALLSVAYEMAVKDEMLTE